MLSLEELHNFIRVGGYKQLTINHAVELMKEWKILELLE